MKKNETSISNLIFKNIAAAFLYSLYNIEKGYEQNKKTEQKKQYFCD